MNDTALILRDPFPASSAPKGPTLAPAPLVDKYPIVIGAGSTLQYLASVMRLCITGYRQPLVDYLRELLERDGGCKSLVGNRIARVAGGRIEITPCELPPGHADEKEADRIAEAVRSAVFAIPYLKQAIHDLGWAVFYGVAAAEIGWRQNADRVWGPTSLTTIRNRRLSYPDTQSWDLHVWDQGQVVGYQSRRRSTPTNQGQFGLNTALYPNKFVVYTPSFAGDYATREGIGRELAPLMLFKMLGLRSGAGFIERFLKIIFHGRFATSETGTPRAANDDDLQMGYAALQQLGIGSLASAMLPDSITLLMEGPATKGDAATKIVDSWVSLLNGEEAKIVRGTALSTEHGKFGSKSSGETGEVAEDEIEKLDADLMAECLRWQLGGAIVRVNGWREDLIPGFKIHIDDPSPMSVIKLYGAAADKGIPVDADAAGEQAGLRLIPNTTKEPRRMAPIKPVEMPATALGGDIAEAARAEAEADRQAQADAEAAKAARQVGADPANDNAPAEGDDTQEPQAKAAELPTMALVPNLAATKTFLPAAADALQGVAASFVGVPCQSFLKQAADGSAGAATAETPIGQCQAATTVSSVTFVPGAALTADNANYATITLFKRTGAGGATQVAQVTTQITGSGNWAAFVPVAIPVTAGAVLANDVLTYAITKTGTGVVVPAGVIEIFQS